VNRFLYRACIALLGVVLLVSCASSRLYRDGQRDFEQGRYEQGLQELSQAVAHDPTNLSYKATLDGRREEAVQRLIAVGDRARAAGNADVAEASYRQVLAIESGNERARNGIEGVAADRRHAQLVAQAQEELQHGEMDQAETHVRSVLAEDPGYMPAQQLRKKLDNARGPVMVTPRLHTRDNRPVTLQFRDAATKMVFEVLSRQTGINFIFDKDVRSDGKTTIFVQDVPIDQAIDLVIGQNQLARQVLSDNMVLIYPNTPIKQKDYQDQIVKTFYLTSAAPKDVEGLLKTVLDAKTLVINERANAVVMRDTPENVRMAEKLVASVDLAEPEVMMEVEVLEITRSRMQQLGITYPGSVSLNAASPSGAAAGLVLNDLSKQNGSTITVSPLGVTLDVLKQSGFTNELASPRIRARNKEKAKILIGSREPVISTAASASGNGGIVSNTSVQYLDVGLTLEVEPTIYANNDVAIKVNLEVSAITKQLTVPTGSGGSTIAYEIGTRNATTLLQLKDGETQILAGLIRDTDSDSASSIPGLGDIPIIGRLFGSHNTDKEKTEIVLSITPRIIRAKARPSSDSTEFWFGTESRSGVAPLGAVSVEASHAAAAAAAAAVTTGAPAAVSHAPVNVNTLEAAAESGATVTGGAAAVTPAAITPAQHAAPQGPVPHPTLTLDGRGDVRVGDEFTVTVNMQSDDNVNHLRAQVRFDASTLRLLTPTLGDLIPEALNAKIATPPGGAQLDVTVPTDAPLHGAGSLMVLKFKALRARPTTAIAAQLAVLGTDGASIASNTPTPLTFAVTNAN